MNNLPTRRFVHVIIWFGEAYDSYFCLRVAGNSLPTLPLKQLPPRFPEYWYDSCFDKFGFTNKYLVHEAPTNHMILRDFCLRTWIFHLPTYRLHQICKSINHRKNHMIFCLSLIWKYLPTYPFGNLTQVKLKKRLLKHIAQSLFSANLSNFVFQTISF